MERICSKCRLSLHIKNFWKRGDSIGGYRSVCKGCFHLYRKEEKHKKWMLEYRIKNEDRIKAYRADNKKRICERASLYSKKRRISDPQFKMRDKSRSDLNKFLSRPNSRIKSFGCSQKELMAYIENQFKDGMTWENRGEWQIDHKIPLIAFDLTESKEFLLANHFTNLQPLWREDNFKKSLYERAIYM